MVLLLKNLLIFSALLAAVIILISQGIKLIFKFIKVWLVVLLILILVKIFLDPSWLPMR